MSTAFPKGSMKRSATPDVPYFVVHESFEQTGAIHLFGPTRDDDDKFSATYMPDDVTRDLARRMHYAAWRCRAPPTIAAAPIGKANICPSAIGSYWATASSFTGPSAAGCLPPRGWMT